MTYRSELDAALARLASIDREGLPCPACVARRQHLAAIGKALAIVAVSVVITAFGALVVVTVLACSFDARFG